MNIPRPIEKFFHLSLDSLFSLIPMPKVDLNNCKIIAHRGAHDNKLILENTLKAFDKAVELGIYGIEFDVRWTKDNIPVVCHDPCLKRVFGHNIIINETLFSDLRDGFPDVPSLKEVITRYKGKLHFMVEVKEAKSNFLEDILSDLIPVKDFHILSLNLENFNALKFLNPLTFLPVAELNTNEMLFMVNQNGYGGLLGHYFLMNNKHINSLKDKNKKIGTGFISSRNCLFREVGRGVDYIFTNNAEKLAEIVG